MKIYLILGILLVMLTGCVPNNNLNQKKDFITHSHTQYPESRFLKATGFGTSRELARQNAKAELANIFESKIESELKLETRAIIDILGEHDTEKIDLTIKVYSLIRLKGVRVVDMDLKEGQHSALAILDKTQARDNWLAEISKCDEMITAEYKSLQKIESKIFRIKPIQKIWNNWMERTSIVSRLTVIGFSAPSRNYQIKDILGMVSSLRNNMRIYIEISGHKSKYLADAIGKVLTNEGFILTDTQAAADVLISGHITVEPVELSTKDWKYSRAKVSLKIRDQATGHQVGDILETVRRGHLTSEESKFKVVKDISNIVPQKVMKFFDPFCLSNKT